MLKTAAIAFSINLALAVLSSISHDAFIRKEPFQAALFTAIFSWIGIYNGWQVFVRKSRLWIVMTVVGSSLGVFIGCHLRSLNRMESAMFSPAAVAVALFVFVVAAAILAKSESESSLWPDVIDVEQCSQPDVAPTIRLLVRNPDGTLRQVNVKKTADVDYWVSDELTESELANVESQIDGDLDDLLRRCQGRGRQ